MSKEGREGKREREERMESRKKARRKGKRGEKEGIVNINKGESLYMSIQTV